MENSFYNVGEPFNLQVEITNEVMKDTVIKQLQYLLNNNYSEIIPGLKLKNIFKNSTPIAVETPTKNQKFGGWSPASNCRHDCSRCTTKCLYRKEKYKEPEVKTNYNGGWVDMTDKNAVTDMFNTVKI